MKTRTYHYGLFKHRIIQLRGALITIRDYRKSGNGHNLITIDVLKGPELERAAVGATLIEVFIDFRYLLSLTNGSKET